MQTGLTQPSIAVSLVSHGHGDLVLQALRALATSVREAQVSLRVWLTLNLPEPALQAAVCVCDWPFELHCIHNPQPLGFGANHNQAFARAGVSDADVDWFVVMNPDIFWPAGEALFWQGLARDWPNDVGLVCPVQVDLVGQRQDFARLVMTPWGIAWRVLRKLIGASPSGVVASLDRADWVNGACMVWRAKAFAALGGFDERYFMYCEDTDICLRLQLAGWRMRSAPVTVVHDARRHTGRNWRHLRWHMASMWRLWCSAAFWRYVFRTQVHRP